MLPLPKSTLHPCGSVARHSATEHARRSHGRPYRICGISEHVRVTFFIIGTRGTLSLYIWPHVEMGIEAPLNVPRMPFIIGSIGILFCANLQLRRR